MNYSKRRSRRALSDLVGTLLMITVTLIAGVAAFGWINGQAATSEGAYGHSVANNINLLNERFTVVTQTFSGTAGGACSVGVSPNFGCTEANFWIYNSGEVAFNLSAIQVRNLTDIPSTATNPNPLNMIFYPVSSSGCSVSPQTCGFAVYNKAGTVACSNTEPVLYALNGFYESNAGEAVPPPQLPQNQLSANPYQIAMPTTTTCIGAGAQYLYDGITYTFTFIGLYGNSVPVTVTVSG